jgi:lipid A ethanolaminephosphotransferase
VSDHGESLGENGFYGHGGEVRPEQVDVPLVIWYSDKFLASHANIKKISSNEIYSHDNIFHTMLDCAGITSDIINTKLSLCNANK